jgi:hypothetical protein
MQGLEQDRRVNVALVIRAEHHRAAGRHVRLARDPVADAGHGQREAHAEVAQLVEHAFEFEGDGDRQANAARDQNVEGDDEVGQYGPDGGNERSHAAVSPESMPVRTRAPGGEREPPSPA